MDFQPTAEEQQIQRAAERLAENEFAADAFTWEDEFPHENAETLAEQGLLGIALPTEYGGGGGSAVEVLLVQEAVGRVCPDTAHILFRSLMGAPRAIGALGSDSLKERFLPPVCAGDLVMSVAISESEAGSDAGAMTTSATVDGDTVTINGRKLWVTKADVAGAVRRRRHRRGRRRVGRAGILARRCHREYGGPRSVRAGVRRLRGARGERLGVRRR
jgi:alkylation response protein AidB-like acyl-CoA dehydrogenase